MCHAHKYKLAFHPAQNCQTCEQKSNMKYQILKPIKDESNKAIFSHDYLKSRKEINRHYDNNKILQIHLPYQDITKTKISSC